MSVDVRDLTPFEMGFVFGGQEDTEQEKAARDSASLREDENGGGGGVDVGLFATGAAFVGIGILGAAAIPFVGAATLIGASLFVGSAVLGAAGSFVIGAAVS